MFIDLARQRVRTISIITKYYSYYNYSNKAEQFIISSSLLNILWNNWCHFWRCYWIFNISGGIYFDKSRFGGIYPSLNSNQACAYAAHLRYSQPVRTYHYGDTIDFYKEPTWGDYDKIINIASNLQTHQQLFSRMDYILNLLPFYMNELKDFQHIRNAFIHLNYNTIKDLESLKSVYIFPNNCDILNILNVKRIGNATPCFRAIKDSMIGLLINL